jgi:hypothetical protein
LRHNAKHRAILDNGIIYDNSINQNLIQENSFAHIKKFFKLSFFDLAFEFLYVSFIWISINSVIKLFKNYKPNQKNIKKFDNFFKYKINL